MLASCSDSMARWGVAHVTPDNVTNQLAALSVNTLLKDHGVRFIITVTETKKMWFPSDFHATVSLPNHDQKSIDPKSVTTNGFKTVSYEIVLPEDDITEDTAFFFWIHPNPESPQAHLGGFYYHFELKSFVGKTGTSKRVAGTDP